MIYLFVFISKIPLHLDGLNLFDSPVNQITVSAAPGFQVKTLTFWLWFTSSSSRSPKLSVVIIVIQTLYFNDSFIHSLNTCRHIFNHLLGAILWVMYRMYGRKTVIKKNTVLALRDLASFFPVQTLTRPQFYEGRHCADFPSAFNVPLSTQTLGTQKIFLEYVDK